MFKLIKGILFLIFIAVIGVVFALGYFGLIPGLSKILGTDKPRDLGMMYSQEKFNSALERAGAEYKVLPASSPLSVAYEGSHEVKTDFTDEELTSLAYNKNWAYYPIGDVQVRINDDNTMEVSGILKLTKLDEFVAALGISDADYKAALDKANIPLKDMPFYAKGYGSAKNNTLDLNMTNFEVGRFPVPQKLIAEYRDEMNDFGEGLINNMPGLNIKEAKLENGALFFDGSMPDVELTKR